MRFYRSTLNAREHQSYKRLRCSNRVEKRPAVRDLFSSEYVIRDGSNFDITVVFKPLSDVEGYVDEILRGAITKFHKDRQKEKIVRNLRQTSDQRFRLYYLLSKEFSEQIADQIIKFIPLVDQMVDEYQKEFPEDKEETGIFTLAQLD